MENKKIKKQTTQLLDQGVVKPVDHMVLVLKKDGHRMMYINCHVWTKMLWLPWIDVYGTSLDMHMTLTSWI